MKTLLSALLFILPLVAGATVHDFENDPKTCYVFDLGRLSYKSACLATGTVGGGIDYVINEVTFSSQDFGRIFIVNNITHNQPLTTINNQTASTQYRHPNSYQVIANHMVNTHLNRGETLLQCIKSQDDHLEICTTDLLQI